MTDEKKPAINIELKKDDKGCYPVHPHHHDDHSLCHGSIKLDCVCPMLKTKTFVLNIGPQTEVSLNSFQVTTFNSWEVAGYLIMAHSLVDTGAGWGFAFTVGWYA